MTLTLLSPGELKEQTLEALERLTAQELEAPTFQRDPGFIEEHLPTVGQLIGRYFASEVRGLEHLEGRPSPGPAGPRVHPSLPGDYDRPRTRVDT